MLICQCVQWHRALSHTGGVSVDLGLNLAVLGACCVFVLCGVGFTALCMRRYLHFSIACSSALSSVANLALLALVLSLQPSPFIESIAPNRYQIFHNLLIYLSLSVLFVMAYLDYVYLALPDSVLVVFFVLGCACIASIAMPASFIWAHIRDALALMGGAFALGLFGEIVFKKPVLGEADIIVLGGIGLVFGVFFALVSVFVASCLVLAIAFFYALISKARPHAIAFVSYLFVGVLITYVGDLHTLAWAALYSGAWYV
ncbi:prepilin peptidase [uncultured Helicobacter sp.]|uniref:prepilin peptidase n=1 Tax=uncultured Helicobacter sp. TaxID=175537 RepID=UPI0037510501